MLRKSFSIPALSLFLLMGAHGAEPLYWYFYDVDTTQDFGRHSSIDFDSEGKLRVGYRGSRSVKYASFDGKFWSRELVDTSTAVDAKMAMALDGKGDPHIFFADGGDERTYYSRKVDGKWTRTFVDSGGHGAYYQMSAVAGGGDTVHVIYNRHEGGGVDLIYNNVSDGKFAGALRVCPNCGYTGKWNDLIIDSLGRPVASYFRDFPRNLSVGVLDSAKWKVVGLDDLLEKNLEGYHNSIARDTGGTFYVLTQNPRTNRMWLLHGKPGAPAAGWTLENLDSLTGFSAFGNRNHVEVVKGIPYVFYSRLKDTDPDINKIGEANLVMAYKDGAAWKYEDIDTNGVVGTHSSVTLSPNGLPAISYADYEKGWLKVAIASLTPPADEDKNGIPDYKEVVSLRKHGKAFPKKSPGMRKGKRVDTRGKALPAAQPGQRVPNSPSFDLPG